MSLDVNHGVYDKAFREPENTNPNSAAAVSFRVGRPRVALRDLFHSRVLPAGLGRKSEPNPAVTPILS